MLDAIDKSGLKDYLLNHPHSGGIIINPTRRFIYMKPTKTAGTSILRKVLEPRMGDELIHCKKDAAQFKDFLLGVEGDALEDFFVFSVVRNPWSRFVSMSAYFGIQFQDFVANFERLREDSILYEHTLPLHFYTHNSSGRKSKRFADFVCRQECLQPDINLVLDKIGVARMTLPHVNKSKSRRYQRYYESQSIDLVQQVYQRDFALFGYDSTPTVVAQKVSTLPRMGLSRALSQLKERDRRFNRLRHSVTGIQLRKHR